MRFGDEIRKPVIAIIHTNSPPTIGSSGPFTYKTWQFNVARALNSRNLCDHSQPNAPNSSLRDYHRAIPVTRLSKTSAGSFDSRGVRNTRQISSSTKSPTEITSTLIEHFPCLEHRHLRSSEKHSSDSAFGILDRILIILSTRTIPDSSNQPPLIFILAAKFHGALSWI